MHRVSQQIAANKLSVIECEEIFQLRESVQNSESFALVQHATQAIQQMYRKLDDVWNDEQFWQLSAQLRSMLFWFLYFSLQREQC